MTGKTSIIAGAVLLIVGCGLGAVIGHYDGKLEAADEFKKTAVAQMEDAQKRIDARDAALEKQSQILDQQKQTLRTMAEAVKAINQVVPGTEGQIKTVTADQLPEDLRKTLPSAPSFSITPESTAILMGKRLLQCEQDKLTLGACRADLTDTQGQYKLAKESADKWETAAKGGTKWTRAKKGLFYAGAAGGGAAIGAAKGPEGAAIGAAGGALL